ncbi:MAG: hypothetical protein ND866_15425 [Pyrinomonadaceae bacterium]|nr:hypothetical protein [Pyrinomonadaceae bacterium]
MNANVSTSRFMARNSGAVLLALFCAGCQLFGGNSALQDLDRLQARLEEFSQIPPREQLTDQPYIKGRLLVVTRKPDMPSLSMTQEPYYWPSDRAKELLAQTPEQVGTVVVLNYSKEAAGSYKVVEGSGGVSAYREVCELILIDRSIPAVIHRKTFRGPEPGSATSISHNQTEVVTPVDLTEVRNYIMKLPST